MKKTGIINHDLSEVIAGMGHTDMLTICDAGLPIPAGPTRIELALKKGVPTFAETLETVATELFVEKVIIAAELRQVSPNLEQLILRYFPNAELQVIPHVEFKQLTAKSKAIVRTGEFTPYANVILISGAWDFGS